MFVICRPTTLQGLFDLKAKYNDAKLIVGNTEVGIEMKFKSMAYPHLVGVTHIAELNRIEVGFRYTLRVQISSYCLSQFCHTFPCISKHEALEEFGVDSSDVNSREGSWTDSLMFSCMP